MTDKTEGNSGNGPRNLTARGFRALTTIMQSRSALAAKGGFSFGTDRDMYKTLGYKRELSFVDYFARYTRDNIAGRIVDAPAKATWRLPPQIVLDRENPKKTNRQIDKFNRVWSTLCTRLNVMSSLERVDRLAGIGRYGSLLIGTRGESKLDQPLPRVDGPQDIIYLSAFNENSAKVIEVESDPASPRFGRPSMYNLSLASDLTGLGFKRSIIARTHWSRIIHVAEDMLEDEVFGRPRLERVWNLMDDLAKVTGGSAEAFWLVANRGMEARIDPEAVLDPADEEALEDEIQEYMDGLRRFVKTQGVELHPLGADQVDPRGVFSVLMALISGTTGIPQRILSGSERGQLASVQDRNNWNERVKERQLSFAEPVILKPFIHRLIDINALPSLPKIYSTFWPPLEVMTDQEKAELAARIAQAVVNISNQKLPVLSPSEFRTRYLGIEAELDKDNFIPKPKPGLTEPSV